MFYIFFKLCYYNYSYFKKEIKMKRKFLVFLLAFITIFTFSGCSCESESYISFGNDFAGGKTADPGYSETLTYKVTYQDKNDYYEKSSKINDNVLSFSYEEGLFVQTLKVLPSLPELFEEKSSDITEKLSGKTILCLNSELTLPLSYTLNGETVTTTDQIKSTVYFCPQDLSFAPIYSKTSSINTSFLFGEDSAVVNTMETEYEILYNLETYAISGNSKQSYNGNVPETPLDKTVEYTFRTAIDNAQIFFGFRNLPLSSERQTVIGAVAFNHQAPKSILISNKSTDTQKTNFTYNGEPVESLTLSTYEYHINEANSAGMSQYYFLQEKVENSRYNSLMVRYVSPIIEFNGLNCLGSLVYELTKVEILEPTL